MIGMRITGLAIVGMLTTYSGNPPWVHGQDGGEGGSHQQIQEDEEGTTKLPGAETVGPAEVVARGVQEVGGTPGLGGLFEDQSEGGGLQCCGSQRVVHESELSASNAQPGDSFGGVLESTGHTVVVGAPFKDGGGGFQSGSVYVFERRNHGWRQRAQLIASDGQPWDRFGWDVDVDDEVIVVGAPEDDTAAGVQSGSAYVFVRKGNVWIEQQKLLSSDAMSADSFGESVAIDGDTIVVGAPYDVHTPGKPGGLGRGSAYVFVRSGATWVEQAKLVANGGVKGDLFGFVDIEGDTVVVGAPFNEDVGISAGSAYVFSRNGTVWSQQAQIVGSSSFPKGQLGRSVALAGNTVLIGATGTNWGGAANIGAAYVFVWNGVSWDEQAVLSASDGNGNDFFGLRVGLSQDLAVVGAPQADHNGLSNAGAAYVFRRKGSGWSEVTKITHPEPTSGDGFGSGIPVGTGYILVGANNSAALGPPMTPNAGAVQVYQVHSGKVAKYCSSGVSAAGCRALLSASGNASATGSTGFVVHVQDAEGGRGGGLVFGTSGRTALPWGNGTSFLCVSPPLRRVALRLEAEDEMTCSGTASLDMNAMWCPACPLAQWNPGAGAVVQAQLWYRDQWNTSNQTTSLSDAIEFTIQP